MTENPHKWRDVAWKKAIIDGAQDAIAYFMPDLASDMDTSREVIGISGVELPIKGAGSDKGMKVSDVFLNVPVRGGDDWSVACLIEQQHENDKGFGARVFDSYICLRAQRPPGRTTVFVIYTGDSKNVNFYTETCYGLEATIKFRAFHLPSRDVEELRRDNSAFARVMYAGRMSYESGDDLALREKYARELLNMADEMSYDNSQRKFILEFSERIFRLNDPKMSNELREAYDMKTVPLRELSNALSKEEGILIGEEKGKFEVARNFLKMGLPLDQIAQGTGLSVEEVRDLR